MKQILTYLDVYSSEVYFTINSGCKRNKTMVGGIISIFSSITMVTLTFFFVLQYLNGSSSSVLSSDQSTENLKLPLHNYPYLLRLSSEKAQTYKEGDHLYSISLKLKVGGGNNTYQWTDDIIMEKCDINKHFGKYAYLFKNVTDLDTYLCPVLRMNNQSVVGIYGGKHLFQYYHFYITMCTDNTNNNKCVDKETMDNKLKATYLDILTLDYNVDNAGLNEKPYTLYVRSDRHSISNTVYKRIWMYIETIDYYKDIGLIFETNKLHTFFRVNSFKYDIDKRNIFYGVTIPGTFANLSIVNYNIKKTYYATYMKAQEFFANVGGILKIINFFCMILNYAFSEASYKAKIVDYIIQRERERNEFFTKKYFHNTPKYSGVSSLLNNNNEHSYVSLIPFPFNSKFQNFKENDFSNSNNKDTINNTKIIDITHNTYNKKHKPSLILQQSGEHRNVTANSYQNNHIKINIFEKLLVKLLFNKKQKDMYFTNYHIINNLKHHVYSHIYKNY